MKKNIFFIFCFFTFGLAAQIPSYIPTNGLVGWWPFNGNANDESGNGNHGTVNGATLTADRNGVNNKAYSFIRNNSNYIEVSSNNTIPPGNSNQYSISLWFKTIQSDLLGQRVIQIIDQNLANVSNYDLLLSETNFERKLCFLNYPNAQVIISPNDIVNNIWTNCILIFDHTLNKVDVYRNSVFWFTGSLGGKPLTVSSRLFIGCSAAKIYQHSFGGDIDDIAIYNRALNQQEITALYQSCTNPIASITPQSSTIFCQGNSVILNASTGTNYTYEWYKDGTIINGATTSSYSALTAGSYTVKVIDGSCNATSSATTLTLIDTLTWTGNVDNDWHKPCNWSPAVVPECCNSVKIPFTSNSPVISGVAKAKNVNVYSTSGATLTVNNGANLQIETCPIAKTENSCPVLPVLTTTVISNTTQTTAISGANITYTGSSNIIARGVCWSTSTAPTIANSKTTDGSGTGSFTSNLTGLIAGTTYYVRAYATNASGTSYGNEVSFSTRFAIGSIYKGGVIGYIYKDGDNGYVAGEEHGIIVAPTDQGSNIQWGCIGTTINGADNSAIGSGIINTSEIIAGCNSLDIAASICSNLNLNNYSDWVLPSIDDLSLIMLNKSSIGGFSSISNAFYWSSTEYNYDSGPAYLAFGFFSNLGYASGNNKSMGFNVRAIRYF